MTDLQKRVAEALRSLVTLGETPECQGTDGSSPVSRLAQLIRQYGADAGAAQLQTGWSTKLVCPLNSKSGLTLTAWTGVLNNDRPFNMRVEGPQASVYPTFVEKANAILKEQRFQPW